MSSWADDPYVESLSHSRGGVRDLLDLWLLFSGDGPLFSTPDSKLK